MRKLSYCAGAVAVLALMVTAAGCYHVSPDTIAKALHLAGKTGANYGLKQLAKSNPAAAKETAGILAANVKNDLLPWINGANLPVSDEVSATMSSKLFNGIDPTIKDAIIAASVALDTALPVPSPGTKLSADSKLYINAFLVGVQEGADQYNNASAGKPAAHWLK